MRHPYLPCPTLILIYGAGLLQLLAELLQKVAAFGRVRHPNTARHAMVQLGRVGFERAKGWMGHAVHFLVVACSLLAVAAFSEHVANWLS
jgi:hypothetical protein